MHNTKNCNMVKPNESKAEEAASRTAAVAQSCKYKGVRKRKWGKWVSEIRLPNSRERIWLGSYDSAEKAARAFDAAQFCLRGESANFNFPDAPPDIDGGRFLSRSEIQIAAAQYANACPCASDAAASSVTQRVGVSSGESSMASDGLTRASWGPVQEPCWDFVESAGSENFLDEYGMFPGFDDLSCGFYQVPPFDHHQYALDYSPEDSLHETSQSYGSFLWNF